MNRRRIRKRRRTERDQLAYAIQMDKVVQRGHWNLFVNPNTNAAEYFEGSTRFSYLKKKAGDALGFFPDTLARLNVAASAATPFVLKAMYPQHKIAKLLYSVNPVNPVNPFMFSNNARR